MDKAMQIEYLLKLLGNLNSDEKEARIKVTAKLLSLLEA